MTDLTNVEMSCTLFNYYLKMTAETNDLGHGGSVSGEQVIYSPFNESAMVSYLIQTGSNRRGVYNFASVFHYTMAKRKLLFKHSKPILKLNSYRSFLGNKLLSS